MADDKGLEFVDRRSTATLPAVDARPTRKRLQQILTNLLSNAFKFTEPAAACRSSVDARRGGLEPGHPVLDGAEQRGRVLGGRYRHRHPAEQAAPDLRGVPAGRRHDQPRVRRHRPRPVDQPRARAPARRRDPRREHAGRGQHLHALPAARLPAGSEAPQPRRSSPKSRRRARRRGVSAAPLAAGRSTTERAQRDRRREAAGGARRQQGAGGGRRHPQRLRAHQRARDARHAGDARRERQGRHRDAEARRAASTRC